MPKTNPAQGLVARPASLHGHVILDWLAETPMNALELSVRLEHELPAAEERMQFHTCDRRGLSLEELLVLLAERGKITDLAGRWMANPSSRCDHNETQ